MPIRCPPITENYLILIFHTHSFNKQKYLMVKFPELHCNSDRSNINYHSYTYTHTYDLYAIVLLTCHSLMTNLPYEQSTHHYRRMHVLLSFYSTIGSGNTSSNYVLLLLIAISTYEHERVTFFPVQIGQS